MSKRTRIQWIITQEALPPVRRNCPKCGRKTDFINSGKFRINGNGRLLDVWLIYRCHACKSTWNLTIYERVFPEMIDRDEYEGFFNNSKELAQTYGTSRELFARNAAQMVKSQGEYSVEETKTSIPCRNENVQEFGITLNGTAQIRADALFAGQMGIPRSQVKKLFDQGMILCGDKKVTAGSRVRDGQIYTALISTPA